MRAGAKAARALLACALAALALGGCETTAEKSARLEKAAKHLSLSQRGLSIARPSKDVKVVDAVALHSAEGAAAAVTVTNTSSHALRAVPIAITVKSASGQTLYRNDAPGLEAALTQISSLGPHATVTWVDDQIPAAGSPASASATVGEAPSASGPGPQIEVQGPHLAEASTGEASGAVRNGSGTAQHHLVVYVLARRSGRIVAAGRAVLPNVAAGASVPFQAFLIGSPAGVALQASAPATAFG